MPSLGDILESNPGWLDEAIDTPAVAEITGLSIKTLNTWRCRGGGPRFLKLGRSVRYRRRAVLQWLENCEARYVDRDGVIHD
ncbi:MAG: helix-turn-helix domain-containing protein [Hyphomonas sp.]|nr:helix-turn-helix domain-containing protein [Hyphomonas sp.]MBU3922320.1 helix-turn-helix domain-containing protein [Alphaproteobacteria bacterium]MBU4063577.1 helix-turn-helix domain-containing protein [Alphaproteobacteria bacterium]MBU4163272.1 helix-turn-helix domain-containing protein [Alphaproteobacteria bacterium]MBU4569272.1 helix-turn-helix domain-containing protein [Alphaproteobacteria bacterium]